MAVDSMQAQREAMVTEVAGGGVRSPAVLAAMRICPRHEFVPPELRALAYDNAPLPIGGGQTISQPLMVGLMTEAAAVEPGDKVLEVGTGSGYQAAVLAMLGARVYSLEIIPELARRAASVLERVGAASATVRVGDGSLGWPEEAPFAAIVVTAAPAVVPKALHDQLADGGRLVIPVGEWEQMLEVHVRHGDTFAVERRLPVRFVPMRGAAERLDELD